MNPPVWQSVDDLNSTDTVFISHEAFLGHESNPDHPECVDRIEAVWQAAATQAPERVKTLKAPKADTLDVCKIHSLDYIAALKAQLPEWGLAFLDSDTYVTPESLDVACYAVGAGLMATKLVLTKNAKNAFCAVRPPGHHASADKAEGFCLFNNIALAAKYALDDFGLERVAIIDFDVHHGNGTQNIFWHNPNVLFISLHQAEGWPFTGLATEVGAHNNILNIPMPLGTKGCDYLTMFEEVVLPKLQLFNPQIIFVSAGFDAHKDDPLGQLNLESKDYYVLTKLIKTVTANLCDNRLVMMLEGGYNLITLEESVAQTLMALSE